VTDTAPTDRTRIKRHPERGTYGLQTVRAILDEALICHLGYVDEAGGPRVIPTVHARIGDILYLHGSAASRTATAVAEGGEVCVVATIVDGLVLARSAFSHSMNYRSVVVYGRARPVTERGEQLRVARALADHIATGRGADARMPTDAELAQTTMLALPIAEVSAKIRTGPPKDAEEDLELPVWAGVLPLRLIPGEPIAAPELDGTRPTPDYVSRYTRPPD
jgi:uncharacterized protein